jgi:hypothetical protein
MTRKERQYGVHRQSVREHPHVMREMVTGAVGRADA